MCFQTFREHFLFDWFCKSVWVLVLVFGHWSPCVIICKIGHNIFRFYDALIQISSLTSKCCFKMYHDVIWSCFKYIFHVVRIYVIQSVEDLSFQCFNLYTSIVTFPLLHFACRYKLLKVSQIKIQEN